MHGVEPICKVLQMAPSCYWRHAARHRDPELRSARAQRDDALAADIQRVWHANWQVYGADKVWLQMNREGNRMARCTVERLMKRLGLQGARRGKKVRTTVPDTCTPCPQDHVKRVFKAEGSNQLWVSDASTAKVPKKACPSFGNLYLGTLRGIASSSVSVNPCQPPRDTPASRQTR
ncbi:hypothetical protein THIARS_60985 [Thiomonas delicata]|uniref:HTH-like domain-containing protein n=1 Tax=Thiomonas delicata TaxID=364030 RepID=A0A238D4Z2_THIDL|nr:hypothetical protein THIARS_60985 [Thiomonas delicata]